jgi:transposase InsO family protein
VPTAAGFLYLAVVLDAWSRKIVGWSMANHLRTELVLDAMARDYQEFRAEVGHDRSKGARQCRDAKNLAYLMPSSTSCWRALIPRRLSTLTG